jgi:multiple sugar transport system permease protein
MSDLTTQPLAMLPTKPTPAGAAPLPLSLPKREKRHPFVHLALILICLGAAAPFLWMVLTSVKTLDNAMRFPPQIIPRPFVPENYLEVLQNRKFNFLMWARNSVIVAMLVVAGITLSSATVAYGFARLRFPGRSFLFAVMLSTMMIPFPVTMVALFSEFKWLNDHTGIQWLGSFMPLWTPVWFGHAFSIFLLRQFFLTIPTELSDAARIDGCGEMGIFLRIMLPLSRPALTVVALFAFMDVWNDFLGPLVFLHRPEQFTLGLGLQTFQSQHGGTPWHLLMAASVLVVLPVIILFLVAQKAFVQGISTTGMKG